MNNIKTYKNGNYWVRINVNDGTKKRIAPMDTFVPSFPENIDVCITKKCDGGCPWCYEGCTPDGKHADILSQKWIESLHPYTELAINGNDLTHPDLLKLLEILRYKEIITNITVNQKHFVRNYRFINSLQSLGYIHGIGVSLIDPSDEFMDLIQSMPNIVVHTINGLLSKEQLDKMSCKGIKLLILGYKTTNRGIEYLDVRYDEIYERQKWLYENIGNYFERFTCVSFDNLALEQLDVRRFLTDDEWEEFYMGDDGSSTFYIDAVDHKFGRNSIAPQNERYDLMDSVDDMFSKIRK